MSDVIEFLFSEPRLLLIFVLSLALAGLVGAWLGVVAGLATFAASVVGLCVFAMVRSVSRSR